jgi:predicted nicotinamide N-methyase
MGSVTRLIAVTVCLAACVDAYQHATFSAARSLPSLRSAICIKMADKKHTKGGRGSASNAKGFGARTVKREAIKPPSHPQLIAVDLGKGKQVTVSVPKVEEEPTEAEMSLDGNRDSLLSKYSHLYGAGDVVWPASVALARMLAHVPSFTAGKRVLELGAGLGLAGLSAAAHAGTKRVVLTDRDATVLELARGAIRSNGLLEGVDVSTAILDWGADAAAIASSIGPESFDVIIAADILYDASACELLASLLAKLMPVPTVGQGEGTMSRALLADPSQRTNRPAFAKACATLGLSVSVDVLPGPEDMQLVGVMRDQN